MQTILVGVLTAVTAVAGCVPVEDEHIRAKDLAVSVPELRSLNPDAVFGFAPVPGAVRAISAEEIRRFAGANGLQSSAAADTCVQYPVRILDRAAVEEAVRTVLDSGTQLEVVDFTHGGVPAGKLVFDGKGLLVPAEPTSEPLLWRGQVVYGTGRAAHIWARVRLTVQRTIFGSKRERHRFRSVSLPRRRRPSRACCRGGRSQLAPRSGPNGCRCHR
jgi:hypothetical protein